MCMGNKTTLDRTLVDIYCKLAVNKVQISYSVTKFTFPILEFIGLLLILKEM